MRILRRNLRIRIFLMSTVRGTDTPTTILRMVVGQCGALLFSLLQKLFFYLFNENPCIAEDQGEDHAAVAQDSPG